MRRDRSGGARPRRRVALLIETSNAYGRGLVEGIADHMRAHGSWAIHLPEQQRLEKPPGWLPRWDGDGIIARIETPAVADALSRAALPVVDVSAARLLPDVPWVETDDAAVAGLAYEHLHERGFRHFAFCGDPRFNWSRWRCEHFCARVRADGGTCRVFALDPDRGWERQRRALTAFLRDLPQPTGVMACYDILARQVLDACRDLGRAVPEQLAVLGVDDDPVLCRLADPPLSSVTLDPRAAGFRAAALLQAAMDGKPPEASAHLMPPLGLSARQSTDVLAIADRHVALALRFIREHADDGIRVADVLAHSSLSRRALESRFRALVGRTPHEELLRTRLARAKILLAETDLPIARIAERLGYEHIEYLSAQFTRIEGVSPRAWREKNGRKLA